MRRILALGLIPIFLLGCNHQNDAMDRLLTFRQELIKSSNVTFQTEITADYGDSFYSFSMLCNYDQNGELTFTVTEPETICDIQGTMDSNGGNLTFDDQILAFNSMASGRISPISAPYILMQALRSGYISAAGKSEAGFSAMINDSYEEDALNLQIKFEDNVPVYGEIFWEQRRILTLQIEDFQFIEQNVNHCIE